MFTNEWKKDKVVILINSPEKIKTDLKYSRPICSLSVLGNVSETDDWKAANTYESENIRVNEKQYDFKSKSVDDAWIHLKRSTNESRKKYVIGVFVDFQNAFDNVE